MEKASLIMVDADLYTSSRDALAFCAPLIRDTSAIFFDDWNSTDEAGGEKRAFRELLGSLEEPEPGEPLAVPSSPYAAAKMAASAYARMFHALYGTPVVLARLFMAYGPAQKDLRKLIPYLVLSLLRGRQPKLSSGASRSRRPASSSRRRRGRGTCGRRRRPCGNSWSLRGPAEVTDIGGVLPD